MVDGHLTTANEARLPLDPHLLRGDGCFETALVSAQGEVIGLDRHLDRLCASLETLRLFDTTTNLEAALRAEITSLLREAPRAGAERVLRVTVTPGLRLLELRGLPPRVFERRRGLTLHPLLEPRRDGLCWRHKTLAWSVNASATRQHPRSPEPTFEGLWLDDDGLVLEGTATNLFVFRASRAREVATPPISRPILPGTTRARAIEALRELGYEVLEHDVHERELLSADAVIATSSLLLAAPALSYGDTALRQPDPGLLEPLIDRLRRPR